MRLIVRQQPARAQVVQENNPKNRKPIDPPPIIELKYDDVRDTANSQWLVSPRTFMMVTLIACKDGGSEELVPGKHLIGQTVSSLHRLKDINNKDGGFFVFGDISARKVGTYKLRFSLFDTPKDTEEVVFMGVVDSDPFPVMPQRDFGSMSESTHLTRTFSDQGVKLRVRKDNRAGSGIGSKRGFSNASPPDTSSPTNHPSIYGGAVQDHHYISSTQSPAVKRHRSSGDYEPAHMYQHMPVGEPPPPHYTNSMPSVARSWTASDQQRVSNSYGQQSHSPMSMQMMSRVQQPMGVQTPGGWQGMHQQSALPSPTSSVSNQQPSYPTATAPSQQQSSSVFGDPGATAAASSVPRQYYSNSYYTQAQGHYQGQPAGDVNHPYPDLSSIPDTTALAPGHNPAYNPSYLQSGGMYPTEPSEVQGGYSAYGMADQKF